MKGFWKRALPLLVTGSLVLGGLAACAPAPPAQIQMDCYSPIPAETALQLAQNNIPSENPHFVAIPLSEILETETDSVSLYYSSPSSFVTDNLRNTSYTGLPENSVAVVGDAAPGYGGRLIGIAYEGNYCDISDGENLWFSPQGSEPIGAVGTGYGGLVVLSPAPGEEVKFVHDTENWIGINDKSQVGDEGLLISEYALSGEKPSAAIVGPVDSQSGLPTGLTFGTFKFPSERALSDYDVSSIIVPVSFASFSAPDEAFSQTPETYSQVFSEMTCPGVISNPPEFSSYSEIPYLETIRAQVGEAVGYHLPGADSETLAKAFISLLNVENAGISHYYAGTEIVIDEGNGIGISQLAGDKIDPRTGALLDPYNLEENLQAGAFEFVQRVSDVSEELGLAPENPEVLMVAYCSYNAGLSGCLDMRSQLVERFGSDWWSHLDKAGELTVYKWDSERRPEWGCPTNPDWSCQTDRDGKPIYYTLNENYSLRGLPNKQTVASDYIQNAFTTLANLERLGPFP